jgi:hypothetical protein
MRCKINEENIEIFLIYMMFECKWDNMSHTYILKELFLEECFF